MTASGDPFVFHDDYGLQSVNDMIDPEQASSWNGNDTFTLRGISDPQPDPDAPSRGVILGTLSGWHVTLTPVPSP